MESLEATIVFMESPPQGGGELLKLIQSMGGKFIKSVGSGHLLIFSDSEAAMRAALQVKRSDTFQYRIGIARGMVTLTHGDILGEAVNLAARLQGIAKPQDILFAKSVFDVIENDLFPIREVGNRQFKGIVEEVKIYSLEKTRSPGPKSKPLLEKKPEEPLPKKEFKPKDVFDFSRVEHERIQEQDSIRATLPASTAKSEEAIPLAEDPKPPKREITSSYRTNPEIYNPSSREDVKKIIQYAAILLLVILIVVFGRNLILKNSPPTKQSFVEKVEPTDLMKALQKRKVGKVPELASLRIETDPPGATVYYNDQLVSRTTPIKINRVPSKIPVTIRAIKPGYEEGIQIVNLLPEEEKSIEITLRRK